MEKIKTNKEILMGPDRPLIGYRDQRMEIHLARNVEAMFPMERPTLYVNCDNCQEELVVFYELSTPANVECPSCEHLNNLVHCISCGAECEQGDQGFMSIDVPYGSRVHDSLFEGPAYACSAKCLVEAFRRDIFDAKEQNIERQKTERELTLDEATSLFEAYCSQVGSIFEDGSEEQIKFQEIITLAGLLIPKEGPVNSTQLEKAVHEVSGMVCDFLNDASFEGREVSNGDMWWRAGDDLDNKLKYGLDWNGH